MAWNVFNQALRIQLPPTQKYVLLVLANYAQKDGSKARPGIEQLIEDTCLGERAIQQALKKLEQRGVIEAKGYRRGGHGRATSWTLHLDNPAGDAGKNPAGDAGKNPADNVKNPADSVTYPADNVTYPAGGAPQPKDPIDPLEPSDAFSKAASLTKNEKREADNRTFEGASSSPPTQSQTRQPEEPQTQPTKEDQPQVVTGDSHENPDSGGTQTSVGAEGQTQTGPPPGWKHQLDNYLPSDPADTRWLLGKARIARDEIKVQVLKDHLARQETT